MKTLRLACAALLGCLSLPACFDPPRVLQGSVTSYDDATHTLVVRDELAPGSSVTFSLQEAEVGARPQRGNIVRIAYHETSGHNVATRVMNISRQAELRSRRAH